jgi:hypothetical protein
MHLNMAKGSRRVELQDYAEATLDQIQAMSIVFDPYDRPPSGVGREVFAEGILSNPAVGESPSNIGLRGAKRQELQNGTSKRFGIDLDVGAHGEVRARTFLSWAPARGKEHR